jgi:ATP-dependent Lon protease
MIIKSKNKLNVVVTDRDEIYPVLPLKTGILFPKTTITLQVGRKENLDLIKQYKSIKSSFVASFSPHKRTNDQTSPIHQVGVIAKIRDMWNGPGNSKIVTIEGQQRIKITNIIDTKPFITARTEIIQESRKEVKGINSKIKEVLTIVEELTTLDSTYSPEHIHVLKMSQNDPSLFADTASSSFRFSLDSKQELLETINLIQRYNLLLVLLNAELNKAATIESINFNVKKTLEEEEERHFLKQQLYEIRKRLGEDFVEEKESTRLKKIIKESKLPKEVTNRAIIEADRLAHLSTASAEYGVTKNYLDWIINLPWNKCKPEDYDIETVEKVLSREYYGPKNLKDQILQRLSMRKHLGGINEGPTLCLIGAHGTGKAAIAKAVAKALGKDLIRISVGGIVDASELKGTQRTFLGAMPGKIIRALRDAESCDPVMLIEDIDYFNVENDSSVNMALLEALDNRINSKFLDNYIGIPFDLSKILFICSVRSYDDIAEQFTPRLEILELPGYIEKEKLTITKRYIIPKLLKKHGLSKQELKFTGKTLSKIINSYTQEAGLLGLSQQLEKICRMAVLEKVTKKKTKWLLNEKNVETYLGAPVYIPEKAEKEPEIGIAAGLAWTGAGGDLMFIEGIKMPGIGQIFTTGSLGEVMQESIQAAFSFIRSRADQLGIDPNDFGENDIHIHFPSGATPKDGPSAGITVCLVIASVLAGKPIRNDIAMTGEVTLRGKVLSVGGIKEKISAAFRAGIYNIAAPRENEREIQELPKEILRKTNMIYLDTVDELFDVCFKEKKKPKQKRTPRKTTKK